VWLRRPSAGVAGEADAAERPAGGGREEVSVSASGVAGRCCPAAPAQHLLRLLALGAGVAEPPFEEADQALREDGGPDHQGIVEPLSERQRSELISLLHH